MISASAGRIRCSNYFTISHISSAKKCCSSKKMEY